MFNCDNCGKTAPARFSPVLVTETRPAIYTTTNPETLQVTVIGTGMEIAKEFKLCPECVKSLTQAQLEAIYTPKAPDFSKEIAFANPKGFAVKHAQGCEGTKTVMRNKVKVKVACDTCAMIIETYARMTPRALSAALAQ